MLAIVAVLVILLLAGLAGGWAAYFTEILIPQAATPAEDDRRRLKRHLVLGLVASFCVPLFLSLLQSSVLTDIFSPAVGKPPAVVQFLVLAGFCLLAAFFSRNFLDTLAAQVLRKAEEAKVTANAALAAAGEAVDKAEAAAEIVDEPVNKPPLTSVEMKALSESVPNEASAIQLSPLERSVLEAMMTTTYRTASGIAADLDRTRQAVAGALNRLAAKMLVERTLSPKTGSPRWRITPLGVRALE